MILEFERDMEEDTHSFCWQSTGDYLQDLDLLKDVIGSLEALYKRVGELHPEKLPDEYHIVGGCNHTEIELYYGDDDERL